MPSERLQQTLDVPTETAVEPAAELVEAVNALPDADAGPTADEGDDPVTPLWLWLLTSGSSINGLSGST